MNVPNHDMDFKRNVLWVSFGVEANMLFVYIYVYIFIIGDPISKRSSCYPINRFYPATFCAILNHGLRTRSVWCTNTQQTPHLLMTQLNRLHIFPLVHKIDRWATRVRRILRAWMKRSCLFAINILEQFFNSDEDKHVICPFGSWLAINL